MPKAKKNNRIIKALLISIPCFVLWNKIFTLCLKRPPELSC
jgi:hypothetical protein